LLDVIITEVARIAAALLFDRRLERGVEAVDDSVSSPTTPTTETASAEKEKAST
jgi:hypothetical protein